MGPSETVNCFTSYLSSYTANDLTLENKTKIQPESQNKGVAVDTPIASSLESGVSVDYHGFIS